MLMEKNTRKKIVIVGGGFGGVKAALILSKSRLFDVTLVSDKPDFRYYPRLYHTATGGSSKESSILLTNIFAGLPITIVRANVKSLNRENKTIQTDEGVDIHFDNLILALGMVTNYFGIPGLDKYAYGIKSNEEAMRLKKHLHDTLLIDKKPDHHYIVIGAGPTGIELAGQLKFYLKEIMSKHSIKNHNINVDLIEAAPRLLPSMPPQTSHSVYKRLQKIKVKLLVNHAVQAEDFDSLTVSGRPMKSHTVIWTAGVTNNPFYKNNAFKLNERGKVVVNEYFQTEDNIFVIGDNAASTYSGLAQTALANAILVSKNLIASENNSQVQKDKPKKPVAVIPAGKNWAAVVWGRVKINGFLGWLLREAADFVAFHDLEPWWKASQQWATEFQEDNLCSICDRQ
jgi:NADH dehydrogenase